MGKFWWLCTITCWAAILKWTLIQWKHLNVLIQNGTDSLSSHYTPNFFIIIWFCCLFSKEINFLSVNTHQLFFNNTTLIVQIYAHQKGAEIFNLKSTHLFMKPQSIANSNGLGIPPVSVSSWYKYWNKIANLWIVIQNLSQIIRINVKVPLLKMKIFKKLFG